MIYRVSAAEKIHFSDPLHVGRFFPHLERRHGHLMQARQDLILYLANIHSIAIAAAKRQPHGFFQLPMRLMTLREWVYDYKTAFDYFFEVAQHGYHVGEKHEISLVIPRKLPVQVLTRLRYVPPPRPSTGVVSKVLVQRQNKAEIRSRLASSGRFDLQAPVEYLLNLPSNEVNFYFSPAGKHQLRDTSTFPVPAIETFPAWLREALFGPGIDIEAAYTQFLIEHLREAYAGREGALKLLYPDLLRSLQEKQVWRRELCELLGLEETEESTALVKRLIMSLANGSRISPALLLGTSGYSSTRDTVLEAVTDTSVENLTKIGERLCSISRQYSTARKHVCTLELRLHPSRANQKKVFLTYFQWEREARYRIWEAVDRHGIMVHDGIDGIPARYLTDIPGLVKSLNLRLT